MKLMKKSFLFGLLFGGVMSMQASKDESTPITESQPTVAAQKTGQSIPQDSTFTHEKKVFSNVEVDQQRAKDEFQQLIGDAFSKKLKEEKIGQINSSELAVALVQEFMKLQITKEQSVESYPVSALLHPFFWGATTLGCMTTLSLLTFMELSNYQQHYGISVTLQEVEEELQNISVLYNSSLTVAQANNELELAHIDFADLYEKAHTLGNQVDVLLDLKKILKAHQQSWFSWGKSAKIVHLQKQVTDLSCQVKNTEQNLCDFLAEHLEYQECVDIMKRYAFLFESHDNEQDFIYKVYACMHNLDNSLVAYKKQAYKDLMKIDSITVSTHANTNYPCTVEKLKIYRQVIVRSLEYLYTLDQYHEEKARV